jgi:hypothetical protein
MTVMFPMRPPRSAICRKSTFALAIARMSVRSSLVSGGTVRMKTVETD